MGTDSEAILNRKFLEMAKLMNIYLNHFPKHEKYGLAQQIRVCMYDVYGLIVECQKRFHKKTALSLLDIKHEQLRMYVSLANSLNYFAFKGGEKDENPEKTAAHRFLAISRLVDELGRMIGGWICHEKKEAS
jgi:hypothetical protein